MIELATVYRARARCSACGWVSDWRSSRSSPASAERRASEQLQRHATFWHDDPHWPPVA